MLKMIFTMVIIFSCFSLSGAVIKVGSSPVISSAGLYLALERGYFKKQGLEVEVFDFNNSGAPMTMLLSKGELDVAAGNLSTGFFSGLNQGLDYKIVADKGHLAKDRDYIALIVRHDHLTSGRYKSLKDLKGMKLGLTALNGVSQEIIAERFLKKAGLRSSDVEFIKLSYAEMNVALKSKNIDATVQLEPYLSLAQLEGLAQKVNSAVEVYPTQQSAVLMYSAPFIKNRRTEAQKFMLAYLLGVRDYNAAFVKKIDTYRAIKDLKKYIKIENDKVWQQMAPVGLADNGDIDKESLMADAQWYSEKKYIDKVPAFSQMVDMSFALSAAKDLK